MKPLPFKIKICGVKTVVPALVAALEGADAIGFNFYPRSKRFVTTGEANSLRLAFRQCFSDVHRFPNVRTPRTSVGVFVNPTLSDIARVITFVSSAQEARLNPTFSEFSLPPKGLQIFDWIQLHGVEPPEFLAQVKATFNLPTMRAFRWGSIDQQPIDEYLGKCAALKVLPDAVLIDSNKAGEYGGTGLTADWEEIANWKGRRQFDIPLVLAGGLTPQNVAAAIRTVQPDAVDAASGVESAPGSKDPELVGAFISEARSAFDALKSSRP